ncbi:MAG: hypothetical protein A2284_19060 [Deltaproteobacteria bacterium RIFOXYA12_FULL_61_11]|nr:MAG: hypothetical protein A2284_19060 [Deltaproteobacteria bacterium RIFOXYA12_FULL_61_11]
MYPVTKAVLPFLLLLFLACSSTSVDREADQSDDTSGTTVEELDETQPEPPPEGTPNEQQDDLSADTPRVPTSDATDASAEGGNVAPSVPPDPGTGKTPVEPTTLPEVSADEEPEAPAVADPTSDPPPPLPDPSADPEPPVDTSDDPAPPEPSTDPGRHYLLAGNYLVGFDASGDLFAASLAEGALTWDELPSEPLTEPSTLVDDHTLVAATPDGLVCSVDIGGDGSPVCLVPALQPRFLAVLGDELLLADATGDLERLPLSPFGQPGGRLAGSLQAAPSALLGCGDLLLALETDRLEVLRTDSSGDLGLEATLDLGEPGQDLRCEGREILVRTELGLQWWTLEPDHGLVERTFLELDDPPLGWTLASGILGLVFPDKAEFHALSVLTGTFELFETLDLAEVRHALFRGDRAFVLDAPGELHRLGGLRFREFSSFLDGRLITAEDHSAAWSEDLLSGDELYWSLGTYQELVEYYELHLGRFTAAYPADTFDLDLGRALTSFSGFADFVWAEAHALPMQPLSVLVFDPDDLHFERLVLDCAGGSVQGLRLTTRVNPVYFDTWANRYISDLAYVPDVNARMLGFRSARIVSELSAQVTAAEQFYYNGLHDWDTHGSLDADDQFERAVGLTNYLHLDGVGNYVVSYQPDFAISFPKEPQTPVVLTVFLWRDVPTDPLAVPDFVYQLRVLPRP